jgi:hypothetical protein
MENEQMDMVSLDPAKLVAGIADGSLADHPYLPVLVAACAGVCAILSVFQAAEGDKPPAFAPPARDTGKGLVVTIGDDIDESRGVVAFDPLSLFGILAEADVVVLQVAAFQRPVMDRIAAAAALGLTVIVIETREQHELEWLEFVKANSKCPVVLVTTRPEDR